MVKTMTRFTVAAIAIPTAIAVFVPNAYATDNDGGSTPVTCTYDGKTYSQGAKVYHPDGTYQLCRSDGTWLRTKAKEALVPKANGEVKKAQ